MEKIEILWEILVVFALAKALGLAFRQIRQPEVIGELLAGALLGPYELGVFEPAGFVSIFADIGVIILLFLAGLETRIEDLKEVGPQAIYVGLLGVTIPFVFGTLTGVLWDMRLVESLFLGTILVATSVGITIRVLAELGYATRRSAKIILGAAVLDDILALIILSVVRSLAVGVVNWLEITLLAVQAISFVLFLVVVGPRFVKRFAASRIKGRTLADVLKPTVQFQAALILCFGLSLLAEFIGLAAIVGAFMAGLVLSEVQEQTDLMQRFEPIGWFMTPFFFVVMGSYVNPNVFLRPETLFAVLVLTVVAIVSKALGSYFGAIATGRKTALEVAVGMIPRGEVGIVIAGIGLAGKAIGADIYAASIGMVILTTFVAPFLIKRYY